MSGFVDQGHICEWPVAKEIIVPPSHQCKRHQKRDVVAKGGDVNVFD